MERNRKIELSTIIGKDSRIEGDLNIKGGLRLDGFVDGKIESDGFVVIGSNGHVKADIKAKECLVSGIVEGNIYVNGALELDKMANVKGSVVAKVLKINAGAVLNGDCSMREKSSLSADKSYTINKNEES